MDNGFESLERMRESKRVRVKCNSSPSGSGSEVTSGDGLNSRSLHEVLLKF